jgi:acyl-coenzyme A thioesterase PaaI-like protein
VTPVNSENIHARLQKTQAEAHPFCFVCSGSNPMGLALRYRAHPDGSVDTTFLGNCALESYTGLLHGGVIAALLDGAMTNCLFAHGCAAMTGELNVRYREPVVIGEEMHIRAWIESSWPPLHRLAAELKQGDCVKVAATAKFMERP